MTEITNNKQEQGRSMVEMLGTLAIIGVLSVGGIAGYTYAMERHYTNEILNAASQRAIVIASQIAAGRQVSLKEFDGQKEVAGGTFDGEVNTDTEGEFGIKVTGVKESVCQKLLKATDGTDVILANLDASAFEESDCSAGSFLITYSNDSTPSGPSGPSLVTATFDNGYPECPAGYKLVNSPGANCANSLSAAIEDCKSYDNYNLTDAIELQKDLGWGEIAIYECK